MPRELGRLLIVLGAVLIVAGLAITAFGRLPGDLVWRRGNVSFYFPLMTSIVLSLLLTLLMWIFFRR